VGVTYTPDIVPFLVILILLALLWGYLIQKTGALWGAVMFHAGADLLILFGIFKTYGASQ
jgi:membrane protease YdiL (CAAX protease family)